MLENQLEDMTERNFQLKSQIGQILKEKLKMENKLMETELKLVESEKSALGKEELSDMLLKIQKLNEYESMLKTSENLAKSWERKYDLQRQDLASLNS